MAAQTLLHRQVRITDGVHEADVDVGMARLIEACWQVGLDPCSSCQDFTAIVGVVVAYVGFTTTQDAHRFASIMGGQVTVVSDKERDEVIADFWPEPVPAGHSSAAFVMFPPSDIQKVTRLVRSVR